MSVQFSVSWIYEEFRVARVQRNNLRDVWVSPTPVLDLAGFHEALIAASAALHMNNGGDVAIAFESDAHSHAFIDLPPMNRRDLEKYLARRVEQEKTFDGDAVWSYRQTEQGDGSSGVLLHVMPKGKLDAIIRICQENHLTPMRLLPLTDVMAQHLPPLYQESEEVIVVAALFDERVEIVVANNFGDILFVRELKYHWRDDGLERLRVDLERTVLYVKQRQRSVTRIALMGTEAASAQTVLQSHVNFPIDVDDDSSEAFFWARAVADISNDVTSNFIPKSVQRTALREKAVRAASWLAVAASLSAISVTGWVEYLIHQQRQQDPIVANSISSLNNQRAALLEKAGQLEVLKNQLVELSPAYPAIPAWFLSHLGDLVPEHAVLSVAELSLSDGRWRFKLEGATSPTLAASADTLAEFESKLSRTPWQANVSDNWRVEWMDQLRSGQAAKTGLLGFRLAGEIR
ncbi:MAG: hypothetical protein AAF387_15335 [Pseudomonadota bacterium]